MGQEIPAPTPEVIYQDPAYLKKVRMKKIAIILGLIILAVILLVSGYFIVKHYILKLPTTSVSLPPPTPPQPKPTLAPTPLPIKETGPKTLELKDCNINPSPVLNPLVSRVIPASKDTPAIIILLGNVNEITVNKDSKTADISLLSFKAEQIHTLSLTQEQGLVFNQGLDKEASVSDLKTGQLLEIQYNCYAEKTEDQRFRLAQVYIRTAK